MNTHERTRMNAQCTVSRRSGATAVPARCRCLRIGYDPERLAAACECVRLHLAASTVRVPPSCGATATLGGGGGGGGIVSSRPAARLCIGVTARVQQALRRWEELATRQWSDPDFALAFRDNVERLCRTGNLDEAVSTCRSAMAMYQEVDAGVVWDMLARVLLLQGREVDARATSLIGGVVQLADIYTKMAALQAPQTTP